jgi:N6-L-threonylcarbamoyladenine synthase
MVVLGIESSCDETAAAIVVDGVRTLSSVVASQVSTHEKYGGVVPELASREHLRKIVPVVDEACRRAGLGLREVDAIAVTEGPGLIGSLLVGLVYGKALALSLGKPLVGVNHLEGHIHAVLLENRMGRAAPGACPDLVGSKLEEPRFPAVTLVVSGGHTSLFLVEATPVRPTESAATAVPLRLFTYRQLGQTRDDAAGEAFDKVAKLLALGYPGGPIIDFLARHGNAMAVDFGRIKMKGNPLDFSFAGLKTAVLYRVRGTPLAAEAERRRAWRKTAERVTPEDLRAHCSQETLDLIASFQKAVVHDLVERTLAAADASRVESVFVSGGVACNSLLRERFPEAAKSLRIPVFFPSPALCTDNAAMIAAAGYYKLAAGERADASLTAHASLPLGDRGP